MSEADIQLLLTALGGVALLVALIVTRIRLHPLIALLVVSLAVGIAATIAITAAAQQAHDHSLTGGNLPTNQLIVWFENPNASGGGSGLNVAPAGGSGTAPNVPNPALVASV